MADERPIARFMAPSSWYEQAALAAIREKAQPPVPKNWWEWPKVAESSEISHEAAILTPESTEEPRDAGSPFTA